MRNGLRIGRLLGIELRVDSSWLLVFALVIWSLTSVFASWHPDWAMPTSIAVAVVSALFFFGSVVVHEMAHSLVARAYGIPVRDITLHMFGGVSNIEREPPTAGAELLIAIVGPIASIGLGVALMTVGAVMTNLSAPDVEGAASAVAHLGPVGTLVMWLGPVNVMVGLFNLVPGFPLDGGRVLRALLWRVTGDLRTATRWASGVGQGTGWMFIFIGALMAMGYRVPFFGGGLGSGLWLALIGLFLRNAAVQHLASATLRDALTGIRVADVMRTRGAWVHADVPLRELVEQWFMRHEARAFPVYEGSSFVGIVSFEDLRRAGVGGPRGWDSRTVRDVMAPRDRLVTATADEPIADALSKLGGEGANQVAVMSGDKLVGILFDQDVARFLELYTAPTHPMRPRHA